MGSAAVVVTESSCLPDALQLSSDAADEWGFWKLSFSAPELGDAIYTCASDPHLKAGTPLGSPGGFWVGGGQPLLTVYCANALPTASPSVLAPDTGGGGYTWFWVCLILVLGLLLLAYWILESESSVLPQETKDD